jgi:hypothetical protein
VTLIVMTYPPNNKPRKTQLEKIQNGIKALTKELQAISLI